MAVLQGLLALIFRSAGKLINTAFGWATTMLFGKVPQKRQGLLSVITFGSVIWMIVGLGVIFPSFATFMLTFVTLPRWVDKGWIRVALLLAFVVIPLVVGAVSLLMLGPEDQPTTWKVKAKAVLKGYPYSLGLALTLIMMVVLAPIMKLRSLAKGWMDQHTPVIVEPRNDETLVRDLQQALARGGIRMQRRQASWMLRLPTRVLSAFAGGAVTSWKLRLGSPTGRVTSPRRRPWSKAVPGWRRTHLRHRCWPAPPRLARWQPRCCWRPER